MIRTITEKRWEEAEAIIASIDKNKPPRKQVEKVAEAYKIFGIRVKWNGESRRAFLSMDSDKEFDYSGFYTSVTPFSCVRDEVIRNVINFRLGYRDYYRNKPRELEKMETCDIFLENPHK